MRHFTTRERRLIATMLRGNPRGAAILGHLDGYRVQEISQPGPGSLRVVASGKRRSCHTLAEYMTQDDDGVPVTVAITIDDGGELFELAMWKQNATPIRSYPT